MKALVVAMGVFFALLFSGPVWSDPPEGELVNRRCPVQPEEETDQALFAEYRGVRVYLCCKLCLKKFRRTPEAYEANLPPEMRAAIARPTPAEIGGSESSAAGSPAAVAPATASPEAEHGRDSAVTEPADPGPWAWIRRIGRLHPMVVHFPIALLFAAGLAELLAAISQAERFGFAARFCLWIGTVGAVVATALGWAAAQSVADGGADAETLFTHRWLGTVTAALALIALGACERAHRRDSVRSRWVFRAVLGLGVAAVGAAGHWGAALVYGWDHLTR